MTNRGLTVIFAALCCFCGVSAQTLHVENESVSYNYPADIAGEMVFGADNTLTALGRKMSLTENTKMWVDDAAVDNNVVVVTYSGASAHVDIAGNIARYVDADVNGGHVSITQSAEVAESSCGEITYLLSGESADGSFILAGSYKASIELSGLTLTNPSGAAVDIQNGKRIKMSIKSGTVNSLTDGADGSQKGCIVCKGHLELKGKGVLNVTGNTAHGIYAKEYVEMKNCTVNVLSSVKDGLNCNQYFLMESGTLNISGVGDDGIQVSFKDETERDAEDTGSITIVDGTIAVSTTADAAKGVKCEGSMSIQGGSITVTSAGQGVWDSKKSKTKASACLSADMDITIDGGTLILSATGGGGKGINGDANLTINGGDITIQTSGGIVAYVNGTLYTNYTGNTDRLDSDLKSSPKGIKCDGDIVVNGGIIDVTTTGKGAEGIESKSTFTLNDGTINVAATDDAINSGGHMYIKGGTVTAVASGNDGLDSNGNLYIEGGYIMAFGTSAPECGIDANEEEGFTVIFTGGTLLAVGGGNSVPSPSSGSTQPYVSTNSSVSANSTISLSDSSGDTLATFTVPANYNSSSNGFGGGQPGGGYGGPGGGPGGQPGGMGGGSVLITCPDLTSGSSYTMTVGSNSSSVTARLTGTNSGPGGRP